MLGRCERESGTHAMLAAAAAGWLDDDAEALLDLGSTSATLATVAAIDGLSAVMHLGHPAQPAHDFERTLLAASESVAVVATVAVTAEWVWVARTPEATGAVIVDEAGVRDRRHALRAMGAGMRLVPTRMPIAERVSMAGTRASLLVEASQVPDGFVELPGSEHLRQGPPVWYGLVRAQPAPVDFRRPAQVWLAFGPRDDHRGSLQQTLGLIAAAGIDLQHLRSHRSTAGPHIFFSSFSCPESGVLAALLAAFEERGVAHRVLAVLPGDRFLPGPEALEPRWRLGSAPARSTATLGAAR